MNTKQNSLFFPSLPPSSCFFVCDIGGSLCVPLLLLLLDADRVGRSVGWVLLCPAWGEEVSPPSLHW